VTAPRHPPDRLARNIRWGLAAGLIGGLLVRGALAIKPEWANATDWLCSQVLDPFGQIFLRLLFFVVVPLVFASLALGVVQLGRLDRLGPLAGRTFLLFAVNMVVAVALALMMMNVLAPGSRLDPDTQARLLSEFHDPAQTYQARAAEQGGFNLMTLVEMFLPRNLLRSVVEFQLLPLILFALLVGAAGTGLRDNERHRLQSALELMGQLMTRIVQFALKLAPYAVAALLMSVVVKLGVEFLKALALFLLGTLTNMALHLFGTLSLLLRLFSRRSPREFFRAVRTILVTAFSTSSSAATLPTTIQVSREQLGISPSTAGFVLPLGATMNMSGSALFEGCVVLFVAQVYGIELGLAAQLQLVLLAVLVAVAAAGVPGGALPMIVGLLTTFGLPAEGIALVLGVERVLDMARTTVNVIADVAVACIVDESVAATPTIPSSA
jgi:DAACS family dicarboxylate/amino acid:cation (Na+ or H+) symporter